MIKAKISLSLYIEFVQIKVNNIKLQHRKMIDHQALESDDGP